MEDLPLLVLKTVLLRPYVFAFFAAFLFIGRGLLGWRKTVAFLLIGWMTAFVCEFSSTRIGVPFGFYYYNGSTVGQELYIADVPFMDSLSFTFLLFGSYCMALVFVLPSAQNPSPLRLQFMLDADVRTAWPVLVLAAAFLTLIDVIIDPVALRGDRWFLGSIYGYPEAGLYFGIPLMNFVGWAVVGLVALSVYFVIDRRLPQPAGDTTVTAQLLLGCALYYGVLLFNLTVTFWIGEPLLGLVGVMIYLPVTLLLALRLLNRVPSAAVSQPSSA
ncbi:MAG TPA: carotenoid biosynthesis protein [Nitrospira sp.]